MIAVKEKKLRKRIRVVEREVKAISAALQDLEDASEEKDAEAEAGLENEDDGPELPDSRALQQASLRQRLSDLGAQRNALKVLASSTF